MQTNNKCKIKSRGAILCFLSVLLFIGCTKEDLGTDDETDENAIAFDCSTSTLRTTETTTDNMQYFRVSAVWNKGADGYEPFMNNQLVEKQDYNWVYSPLKYWPKEGTVSFFAYSPATSAGLESFQITNATNQVSIEYTVSDNYQKQEDFIVATSLDQADGPTRLDFKHVLSMVKFKARSKNPGVTIRINELKLINLYSKGTLTGTAVGEASIWTWSDFSELKNEYAVYQKNPFITDGSRTYQEVGELMVLPQELGKSSTIRIFFETINGSGFHPIEYGYKDISAFEMNKRYTFYFDLAGESSSSIRASNQDICEPEVNYYVVCEPIE